MNRIQKVFLLGTFYSVFLGAITSGLVDAYNSLNTYFITDLFMYVIYAQNGLYYQPIVKIVLSPYFGLTGSIFNMVFYLALIPWIICSSWSIWKKFDVSLDRKTSILIIISFILFYMAIWDMTFMIAIFNWVDVNSLGKTVDWLPFVGQSVAFGWEFGIWFIFLRLAVATVLWVYVFGKLGYETKTKRSVSHVIIQ